MAAAINDDGSTSLVTWPWPQAPTGAEREREVVADGVGIVVRDGEQIAWAKQDGHTLAHIDSDLTLAAADPHTVWLFERSVVDPGHSPAAAPPLPPGRIVALSRDGSRIQIPTTAPVTAILVQGSQVWVTLTEPPSAHPIGHGRGSWSFEYPSSVFCVSRDALLADGLTHAVPVIEDAPRAAGFRPHAWSWLEAEPATVLAYGERAGELVWWAGAPVGSDKIERQVVVVGHNPSTGQAVAHVDLGRGLVGDVRGSETNCGLRWPVDVFSPSPMTVG